MENYQFDQQLFVNNKNEIFHNELEKLKIKPGSYPIKIRRVWVKKNKASEDNSVFRQMAIGMVDRHSFFDWDTKTAWIASRDDVETYHFDPHSFIHVINSNSDLQLASAALSLDDQKALLVIHNDLLFYSPRHEL